MANNSKTRRILLIEDNKLNLMIMSRLLRNMGVVVVESNSGKEALKHAIQEKYSMIFMGTFVPIDLGCETIENIRDLSLINKDIPIIGVSTVENAEKEKIIDCGITEVINKPLVVDEVKALFIKYPIHEISNDFKVFNSKAFESFYSEKSLKKEIVSIFIKEKESDLNRVKEAFDSRDKKVIYEAIHYMKGSFSYLKADNILELTQEILDLLRDNNLNEALLLKDSFMNKYKSLIEEINIYSTQMNG